jgi:hypothetical protein
MRTQYMVCGAPVPGFPTFGYAGKAEPPFRGGMFEFKRAAAARWSVP